MMMIRLVKKNKGSHVCMMVIETRNPTRTFMPNRGSKKLGDEMRKCSKSETASGCFIHTKSFEAGLALPHQIVILPCGWLHTLVSDFSKEDDC